MRTIRHSLAWKEWHEHKWKLVAITAILWSITALVLLFGLYDRYVFGAGQVALIICIVPLSVFVGLGEAASESSHGTLPFLNTLPVPRWQVALHKVAFGLMTVVVPVLLTILLIVAWMKGLEMRGIYDTNAVGNVLRQGDRIFTRNWIVDTTLATSMTAASLFIWSAAAGVNRKDEISAGALALAAMVGWWLLLSLLWQVLLQESTGADTARLRAIAVASAPAGLLSLPFVAGRPLEPTVLGLASAIVTHGLLAAWYVRGFGRRVAGEIRSTPTAELCYDVADWLPPPRRSPLTAIAWKQLRESGPIVMAGFAGTVGTVALCAAAVDFHVLAPDALANVIVYFGLIVALVLGIGVSLNDMGPKLGSFWRSRPVHLDMFFWTKFTTGLAVLLASIYVPLFGITWLAGLGRLWDQGASFIPMLHVAIFAAAVLTTCLVRHAVYAAILSIAVTYLNVLATWGVWLAADLWRGGELPAYWIPTETQIGTGLTASFVISTLLAWLAMRYDWGRKTRY